MKEAAKAIVWYGKLQNFRHAIRLDWLDKKAE